LYTNEELAEQRRIQFELEKEDHDHQSRKSGLIVGKSDKPEGRFQFFCLESSKTKRLIASVKTKSTNSKLTSVLATVLCVAWRNLFKRFGVADVPLDKFQYVVLASIREKLGISNTQMGIYSSMLHAICKLSDSLCAELENERFDSFWRLCDEQSSVLAEKLKRNEEFALYAMLDVIAALLRDGRFSNEHANFTLSNIGVMGNTCTGVITVKEHACRAQLGELVRIHLWA
jgi:hypothetical protein